MTKHQKKQRQPSEVVLECSCHQSGRCQVCRAAKAREVHAERKGKGNWLQRFNEWRAGEEYVDYSEDYNLSV